MLHVVCWNIQKVSSDKAYQHRVDISATLATALNGADSFVVFILEVVQKNALDTCDTLCRHLSGRLNKRVDGNAIHVGGSEHTAECIIALWHGVDVTGLQATNAWQVAWQQHKQDIDTELEEKFPPKSLRSGFQTRTVLRDETVFRSPLRCTFKHGQREYDVLACHAPGPSHGSREPANIKFAPLFLDSVLSTAQGKADIVIGDFNLYGSVDELYGFQERSLLTGGTTFTKEQTQSHSRLDRVFIRPGLAGSVFAVKSPSPEVSDHFCLSLRNVQQFHSGGVCQWFGDTLLRQSWATGLLCATCRRQHGNWASAVNYWHKCRACGMVFCDTCGGKLARHTSGWSLSFRERRCPCKGTTQLVG